MPRKPREPRVEARRVPLKGGGFSVTWCVRYYDEDGVRRRMSCAGEEEAEFERARLALEYARAGQLTGPRRSMTLAEFWPTWRDDARGRLAENTFADYEASWRRYLEPRFGNERLDEIEPRMISRWRGALGERGVGREAIRKAMVLLQAMFTLAVEWGEATHNPVSLVRKPRQGRQRAIAVIDPQGVEGVREWLLERGDLRSATMVSVLAYSGLRPGELLALELRHVREQTILVEQAVARGKVKLQKTGRVYRTVDLLPALRGDLAAYVTSRRLLDPAALLFAREDGEWFMPTDWANWRKRKFHAATRAVGLGQPRPYDLRHSFASLKIREGQTSIVELAEQLGHSPTETLKTYAHVFAEYRRARRVSADVLISRARNASVPRTRKGETSSGMPPG